MADRAKARGGHVVLAIAGVLLGLSIFVQRSRPAPVACAPESDDTFFEDAVVVFKLRSPKDLRDILAAQKALDLRSFELLDDDWLRLFIVGEPRTKTRAAKLLPAAILATLGDDFGQRLGAPTVYAYGDSLEPHATTGEQLVLELGDSVLQFGAAQLDPLEAARLTKLVDADDAAVLPSPSPDCMPTLLGDMFEGAQTQREAGVRRALSATAGPLERNTYPDQALRALRACGLSDDEIIRRAGQFPVGTLASLVVRSRDGGAQAVTVGDVFKYARRDGGFYVDEECRDRELDCRTTARGVFVSPCAGTAEVGSYEAIVDELAGRGFWVQPRSFDELEQEKLRRLKEYLAR